MYKRQVAIAVIWIGLQVYFGASNPFYVVSSGSMYPQLAMYDIIVVSGHVQFSDVTVGDIIVFDRPKDQAKVIVHRVVAIVDDDPKLVRTKGDNNQASIDQCLRKINFVKSNIKIITSIIDFNDIDDLAQALLDNKISISKISNLKPSFRLSPPRGGFKKSTRRMYSQGGTLGYNPDLLNILSNMM